jgi:hypothetical protein
MYSFPALDYLLANLWSLLYKHATDRGVVEPLGKHIENQSHSQLQAILMYCGTPSPPRSRSFSRTLSCSRDRDIKYLQSVYTLSGKENEN